MSEGSPETDWSVNTMSKGNKVVSMRFPKEIMEKLEAEARTKGMFISELCRKIVIERTEGLGREASKVAPTPTPNAKSPPDTEPRQFWFRSKL